jgi:hypothetical protein
MISTVRTSGWLVSAASAVHGAAGGSAGVVWTARPPVGLPIPDVVHSDPEPTITPRRRAARCRTPGTGRSPGARHHGLGALIDDAPTGAGPPARRMSSTARLESRTGPGCHSYAAVAKSPRVTAIVVAPKNFGTPTVWAAPRSPHPGRSHAVGRVLRSEWPARARSAVSEDDVSCLVVKRHESECEAPRE